MKANRLLTTLGLGIAIAAPLAAEAQFSNNLTGGFFAARPFTFRTFGNRQFFAQPLGFNQNFNSFGNPYANLIGRGPLNVNPNSQGVLGSQFNSGGPLSTGFSGFNGGILQNSGLGFGSDGTAFTGGGTLNTGFDPRFGNQAVIQNGFFQGTANPLNPFSDPNGGFFNPNLQSNGSFANENFANSAQNLDMNRLPNQGFNSSTGGAILNGNGFNNGFNNRESNGFSGFNNFGPTIIDRGVGAPLVSTASAPGSMRGQVSTRIEKGRFVMQFTGDPGSVRSITFSLLDASGKPLRVQIINRMPAEARMILTNRTERYRVEIEYLTGQNQVVEGRV